MEQLRAGRGEEEEAVAEEVAHPQLLLDALLLQQSHLGRVALLLLLLLLLVVVVVVVSGGAGCGEESLDHGRGPLPSAGAPAPACTAQCGQPGASRGHHCPKRGNIAAPLRPCCFLPLLIHLCGGWGSPSSFNLHHLSFSFFSPFSFRLPFSFLLTRIPTKKEVIDCWEGVLYNRLERTRPALIYMSMTAH